MTKTTQDKVNKTFLKQKGSIVFSIFFSIAPSNILNYSHISLQLNFHKNFESIVANNIHSLSWPVNNDQLIFHTSSGTITNQQCFHIF